MVHPLVEKAMILNLSIGIWQGQRLDKDATQKVTSDAGAAADAARVNKHLVPKEALAPIVTAQGAVRTHFHTKTLPWKDNGDRLMTRLLYMPFIQEHERLVALFNEEVDDFLTNRYRASIEQAEFRMGSMFKREDYPPEWDLRRRFYINLSTDPVGTAGDFRVAIDQAHVDKVRAEIEAATTARIQTAMGDVWRRMSEVVSRFHERMASPDAVFRDSLTSNIDELLDLVPGLNIVDDPNVEAVRAAIAKSLGGLSVKEIRKDSTHRAELADEASAIMRTMEGFMSAFGTGSK